MEKEVAELKKKPEIDKKSAKISQKVVNSEPSHVRLTKKVEKKPIVKKDRVLKRGNKVIQTIPSEEPPKEVVIIVAFIH